MSENREPRKPWYQTLTLGKEGSTTVRLAMGVIVVLCGLLLLFGVGTASIEVGVGFLAAGVGLLT